MSLKTLLEAAEFLERNLKSADGNQLGQPIIDSVGGHLKIDPNLPISFQFHTYSSSVPSSNKELNILGSNRSKLNRFSGSNVGRTKSASFSVSNSSFQSRATIRRNRNLTCSDKTAINEATSRHRELHKTLEKNRRAHLRSCFNELMNELPKTEYTEKKYSHINIIHYAIRYIHQLKQTESDHKEELNKLNRLRSKYESSLLSLKQQLIDELNQQSIQPNSTNQSNDSSLENLNDYSDSEKRVFSVRSQEEIDELLLQVEQSLLCASENGSVQFSNYSQLDNSDEYDDETTCSASEGDEYGSVSNSSMLSKCHA